MMSIWDGVIGRRLKAEGAEEGGQRTVERGLWAEGALRMAQRAKRKKSLVTCLPREMRSLFHWGYSSLFTYNP